MVPTRPIAAATAAVALTVAACGSGADDATSGSGTADTAADTTADRRASTADTNTTADDPASTADTNTTADDPASTADTNTTADDPASTADTNTTADNPASTADGGDDGSARPTASGLDVALGQAEPDALPTPLIEITELRSGGPPPDGIPAIDDPVFVRADEATFLADREPVLALEIDGDARAYPVQILTWHEIVNDTVGGTPVAVTYCPLCNSALAYDRRVEGSVLDFGTSGLLWNSALVMYDRQTETLWSHFTGEGIVGALTGVELDAFAMSTVGWATWRDANPDGQVLTTDTGFDRDYGRNPYPGYDDVNGRPFLFEGEVDGRYTAMTRFVGVEVDGDAAGIPLPALQAERVVAFEVAGIPAVALWQSGATSALDSALISDGADVGATGVFHTELGGTELSMRAVEGFFVDEQTGTTWDVLGRGIDGDLAGQQLTPLTHVDTFWFAWSTFRPDTAVIGS